MTETSTRQDQLDLLRDLRSVRAFTAEPVPAEALQEIYDIVRLSGSATSGLDQVNFCFQK